MVYVIGLMRNVPAAAAKPHVERKPKLYFQQNEV